MTSSDEFGASGDRVVTAEEVWAVRPVLRRVVAGRVRDEVAVDDLVQDAVEHLLGARARLVPEMVVPYGVVTARNLAASYRRRADQAVALQPQLLDLREPEEPDDAVLRGEEYAAMSAALAQLPDAERALVWAHEVDGTPIGELAGEGARAGTVRGRLARSRAKLRVEYVLALRGVELPSQDCRPALLVLAGSDRGRQASVATGRHLLSCEVCSSLSQPLIEGRRSMAVLLPMVALRHALNAVRAHPATAAIGTAATAAAVAGLVVASHGSRPPAAVSAPPVASTPSSTTVPTTSSAVPTLAVDGQPLPAGNQSLADLVGRSVTARGAAVESVVTHNGFWVGSDGSHRVWVQLVGPLRPLQVTVGEHVSFVAPLVGQDPGYPAAAG